MEDKIKKVMSDVFGIHVSQINDESTPDNIENWDSFNQMNLIVSLEEEFGITFTDDEIVEMISYPLIRLILRNMLNIDSPSG
jgi:acyl carrier protein